VGRSVFFVLRQFCWGGPSGVPSCPQCGKSLLVTCTHKPLPAVAASARGLLTARQHTQPTRFAVCTRELAGASSWGGLLALFLLSHHMRRMGAAAASGCVRACVPCSAARLPASVRAATRVCCPRSVVSTDRALPGRAEAMRTSEVHYVLRTPLKVGAPCCGVSACHTRSPLPPGAPCRGRGRGGVWMRLLLGCGEGLLVRVRACGDSGARAWQRRCAQGLLDVIVCPRLCCSMWCVSVCLRCCPGGDAGGCRVL
jgi:hypothetical protein